MVFRNILYAVRRFWSITNSQMLWFLKMTLLTMSKTYRKKNKKKVIFILKIILNILDVIYDEQANLEENGEQENDDTSATSSSVSDSSDENDESNEKLEWLVEENGCAVCETCLAHLASKKKVNMHDCQWAEHLVPMDKSKFGQVEFYGAMTDTVQFFYEKSGYSSALDELKGVDIAVNMCKPCYITTMNKIKNGKHFKLFFIYVFR